jgi:hypothetical protein
LSIKAYWKGEVLNIAKPNNNTTRRLCAAIALIHTITVEKVGFHSIQPNLLIAMTVVYFISMGIGKKKS